MPTGSRTYFSVASCSVLRGRQDRRLGLHLRHDLAVDPIVDRTQFRLEAGDRPAVAAFREVEVDDAEMAAPEARHDGGLAVEGALLHVDAGNAGEFLAAREGEVLMAGQDDVDAVHPRQVKGRVLLAALALAARDAGMAERHDDLGAGLPEIGHVAAGRVHDVGGGGACPSR